MILDTIAQAAKRRVAEQKKQIPPEEMRRLAETVKKFPSKATFRRCGGVAGERGFEEASIGRGGSLFPFETALKKPGLSFICEVKKASPSKGIIADDFPYLDIARDYERAGADAISVLTEPEYFLGSADYLREIGDHVSVPLLRKDFIIDDYQLYESKILGADAVLLICALLDTETIRQYLGICDELGLSALVEAHNETEIRTALYAGARIIGVNNRDLKTFEVDINNCMRLRPLVPKDIIYVAESGIKTADDISILRSAGIDTVLIGETLMRSKDKKAALEMLRRGGASRRGGSMTKLKICGLTRRQDIDIVNDVLPDYIGFVFADSKRRVTPLQASALKARLDPRVQAVGVFVNADIDGIAALVRDGVIDFVQLHGDEDAAYLHELKSKVTSPVVKAVRVQSPGQVLAAEALPCDYLLLDAFKKDAYGGTGTVFDYTLIPKLLKPFFIAGGLNAGNIKAALDLHPYCLDISSGVETDGVKDAEKIWKIVDIIRNEE